MFGIDWVVVALILAAGVRVMTDAVLDGIAQVKNPGGEAPSVARRRARADLAHQKNAARVELAERQRAAGIPPAPGQAVADRLARFIAEPPAWPGWVLTVASYLGLLLDDRLERARRRHLAKEAARMARERGEAPVGNPDELFCASCRVTAVSTEDALCPACALVVKQECPGCGVHVAVAELADQDDPRCSQCRIAARAAATPPHDPDVAVQLSVPWTGPEQRPDPAPSHYL